MVDRVTIADSIRYGRYKAYIGNANRIADLITKVLPHARKLLDLPEHLVYHIRPLGGKYNGVYMNFFSKIELEVRRTNLGSILETIMHELVHAEQFHQGRLKLKSGMYHWHDAPHKVGNDTYAKYRARPWEAEAFERQADLALKVTLMIAKESGVDITDLRVKYANEIKRVEEAACL
jgi:hypothetical protein